MRSFYVHHRVSRTALAAALLVGQALPVAAAVSSTTPAVELLVQKAQSLEARDREDLAVQVWQQVLVANPDQPTALAHLARWAKRNNRAEEANTFLQRLRRVSPESAELSAANTSGQSTQMKNRLDEAAKLAGEQRFEEAMRVYRDVFGGAPPPGRWAVSYYETLAGTQGGSEPAIVALKDLAAKYPNVPDYQVAAGRLMTYNSSTRQAGVALLSSVTGSTAAASKAKIAWRQALVWERQNPVFSASVQAYLSRYPDSELDSATTGMRTQAAIRSVADTPESREEQAGYSALKTGDLAVAERHFQAALSKGNSARARAGLGFVAMKKDDFDTAAQEFENASHSPTAGVEVRNGLRDATFFRTMRKADVAAQAGDWTHAAELYHSALAINPANNDALSGVGGALLAAQQPTQAIPFFKKIVAQQPSSQTGWSNLVKATLDSGDAKGAMQLVAAMPESVASKLAGKLEWKATKALVYRADGSIDQALSLYRDVISSDTVALPASTQVQLATLALEFQQPSQAVLYAQKATELTPSNAAATELLVSAMVASKRYAEAQHAFDAMSPKAQASAMTHPGFQQSMASLKEASGDLEGARSILQTLAASNTTMTADSRTALRLHIADVNAKLGNTAEAEATLTELSEAKPNDPSIWRSRLLLLNQMHKPGDIVSVSARIPQSAALRLGQEGDIVTVLASANAAVGRADYSVRLLETYISRSRSIDPAGALGQKLQLGWLLLDVPNSNSRLFRLLEDADSYPAMSNDERKQLSNLWATWIIRSSEAARTSGDTARALALLEEGVRIYKNNPSLQRSLAGQLLASGNSKRAFNVYCNWGLTDGQPDDYAGAIGAALSEHNVQYAGAWSDAALAKWPTNAKILTLAGELAQQRGDLKHAKALWKEAIAQKKLGGEQVMAADTTQSGALRSLLVGANPMPEMNEPVVNSYQGDRGTALPGFGQSPVEVHLSRYDERGGDASLMPVSNRTEVSPARSFAGLSGTRTALGASPALNAVATRPSDNVEDKLASIESRNTPYLSSRMNVWGRGGQAGFSKLLIEQAEFEASMTMADTLRASLILKPTYLTGGTADGSGTSLFGTQTAPAAFGPQSASGVAAEAQLSSSSVGVRLGSTPRGFLTNNWIGGFRLQPWSGPITLLVERDSVKDTMLSYAGARDPVSNLIMGGVMANSATLQAHWGTGNSGLYASGGYQSLTGRNVAKNTGFNGNAGAWWKVAMMQQGDLTVGMNFTGMGYDRNLRYFTYGQGGYFSPQQYFLFNVPVRWTGSRGRLQYTIGGSLGLQHFTEDASDYYPTDRMMQALSKKQYGALVSTGANFGFDSKVSYQLAPHWMLGAFMTASNARNYTAASGGLFLKYTFEERPMSFVDSTPSIPDWRGQQPFQF